MSIFMASYNIYCDESCHLLNDESKVFTLGGVWVEKSETETILKELRALKTKHNLSATFEAKWTKVSKSKEDYYCELVKYFFDNDKLHFRAVVVPDKSVLDHTAFNQDHDTWYYKMFYLLLSVILQPESDYNLYLDIKDTKSNLKVLELKRILNIANADNFPISKAQQIRSHEVELMQVTDILLGALSYAHRGLQTNEGKKKIVEFVEASIGKGNILGSSPLGESKFNVLVWKPRTQK
jgi:hypothetical protein